MLKSKNGLCSVLLAAMTLASLGAYAQDSDQSAGSAPQTDNQNQTSQRKPLRPRKRIRQAIMNKMKEKKAQSSAGNANQPQP